MEIKKKTFNIKLIDGSVYECECASLSTITLTNMINTLLEQGIIKDVHNEICDTCPLRTCREYYSREYRVIGKQGVLISDNDMELSLFESGFKDGDCIQLLPPPPCSYSSIKRFCGVDVPHTLTFKVKNINGQYFDWSQYQSDNNSVSIKDLFESLIRYNILPPISEIPKSFGEQYSCYGILIPHVISLSSNSNLTFQELGFKSGDEIWLGLLPTSYDSNESNLPLKGIVVSKLELVEF